LEGVEWVLRSSTAADVGDAVARGINNHGSEYNNALGFYNERRRAALPSQASSLEYGDADRYHHMAAYWLQDRATTGTRKRRRLASHQQHVTGVRFTARQASG